MIMNDSGLLQVAMIPELSSVEQIFHAAVTVVANRIFGTNVGSVIPIPGASYPSGGVVVGGAIVHVDRTRVFVVTGVTFRRLREVSDCYRETAVCCALDFACKAFRMDGCGGLKKLIDRHHVEYGKTDRPLKALIPHNHIIELA